MIPDTFGWTGGIEQGVRTVPDPSLTELPLPDVSTPSRTTAGSDED